MLALLKIRFWPLAPALGVAGLLGLATAGCGYTHGPEPVPCNDPTPATYAAVISPILDANCRACHGSGVYQTLGGGNNYGTYADFVKQSPELIIGCIEHQPGFDEMPKGGAKLSDCDIARLKAWLAAGRPNN